MAPLEGVRVLDLSRMLPGGVLCQLLADLGAEVLKVERPGTGEEARHFGAPVGETTAAHAFLDRGKRSLAINLQDQRGVAAVHALVATCDVVVESFRPGVADRLGVGYDELSRLRPRLVYCSINGYGTGGPRDAEPGHDVNYLAYAGALNFGGSRQHGPQLAGIQVADLLGGLAAGIGLLSCVLAAKLGGPGRRVEVALADAALWGVGLHASSWLAGGGADGPESTAVTGAAPSYRVYRCSDGRYLSIGAVETRFWSEFVGAIGRDDLVARQHDESVVADLAALLGTRPRQHWLGLLAGRETCVAPVQDFAEVADDPQFAARQMVVPVPGARGVRQVAQPIRLSTPLPSPRPAATVGADSEHVLGALGLPADVLDAVRAWQEAGQPQGGTRAPVPTTKE